MPHASSAERSPAHEAARAAVVAAVDRSAATLVAASRDIHAHPELAFAEHHAHDLLTGIVADAGHDVERSAFGVGTAFRAAAGAPAAPGVPVIALMSEYDALPDIGHACGHNIIATAGLGAFLAVAAVAESLGGRVVLLGTPAEEGGGGKIVMADRGALDGVDAALMVHPAGRDLARMDCVAIQQLTASYAGAAAHAAAAPHKGRNALDAAVLGYMGVAALRQHIEHHERIHGVFTKGGGRPNIVPEEAETFWYVRSGTMTSLERLRPRVAACLEAGAVAAGCGCTLHWDERPYSDMVDNVAIGTRYAANAAVVGRTVEDPRVVGGVVGSTDMGNVSYLVPSIHPMIQVSPPDVAIHTRAFADYAGSEPGDRAVVDGATVLALTVVDLLADAGLRDAAHAEWAAEVARRRG
jgi:amidohydrolase